MNKRTGLIGVIGDIHAFAIAGNAIVAGFIPVGAEKGKEPIRKPVHTAMYSGKQVVAPDLLKRQLFQGISFVGGKALHEISNLVIPFTVLGKISLKVFMILYLDSNKPRITRRSVVFDIDIKGTAVARIGVIITPGRILEENFGDSTNPVVTYLAEYFSCKGKVALQWCKEIECHRLAGKQVIIHPLFIDQLAISFIFGTKRFAHHITNLISKEIRQCFLCPRHFEHGPKRIAFVLPNRIIAFLAPNCLQNADSALKNIIAFYQTMHLVGKLL